MTIYSLFKILQKNNLDFFIAFISFDSNDSGASPKEATNSVAEIHAALIAIKQAARLGIRKLCVNTDSKNLVDAINVNITKWKTNNWRSTWDHKPIKNRHEFEALDIAIRSNPQILIKFLYIPGHSGNEYHNAADHLARKGAENR